MTVRVLIVEDAAVAGRTLVNVLSAAGHDVRWETTGRDALRAVDEWRPDVVLLDRELPDADGVDLARQVHGADRRVVVLSGHRAPDALDSIDQWLMKPVSNRELLAAIAGAS